jgi:hypothetical protein
MCEEFLGTIRRKSRRQHALRGLHMNKSDITFWLSIAGIGCWLVCFWWMWRISSKQESLLKEITEQGQRIEKLSKDEHDLIRDVHPKVQNIKDDVAKVAESITPSR